MQPTPSANFNQPFIPPFLRNPNNKENPQNKLVQNDQVQEAEQESVKESLKEETTSNEKFDKLVEQSSTQLIKISAFWPFDFFPNQIVVDINKIDIVFKEFFYSERVHTILIKNVIDVMVDYSLFFASIEIVVEGFQENLVNIHYLKKKEAIKVKRIISGLVVANKQGIDLAKIDIKDLAEKLEEIGKVDEKH